MKDLAGRTLLEQLDELSSAEDFFLFFLLPYDERVLNVCRLHIMKRMGQYLKRTEFGPMTDDEIFLHARLQLKQAYLDFVTSTPVEEKVFKVFADKAREKQGFFVDLSDLSVAAE
jgi:nitrogenase-stabilizing/protective protein